MNNAEILKTAAIALRAIGYRARVEWYPTARIVMTVGDETADATSFEDAVRQAEAIRNS